MRAPYVVHDRPCACNVRVARDVYVPPPPCPSVRPSAVTAAAATAAVVVVYDQPTVVSRCVCVYVSPVSGARACVCGVFATVAGCACVWCACTPRKFRFILFRINISRYIFINTSRDTHAQRETERERVRIQPSEGVTCIHLLANQFSRRLQRNSRTRVNVFLPISPPVQQRRRRDHF